MPIASDVNAALRHWWHHDRPKAERAIRKHFNCHALSETATRVIVSATGDAFRAGWAAHAKLVESQGQQADLFGGNEE